MILDKDMIVNYEYEYFNKVKRHIQDVFPNNTFLFILESWNIDEKGIIYIKNNHMNLNHYETWISIYPLSKNSYITIDDIVLTACSHLFTVKNDEFIINDSCIYQLVHQIEEIIDDINYSHTKRLLMNNNDEFCMHAKMLSQ